MPIQGHFNKNIYLSVSCQSIRSYSQTSTLFPKKSWGGASIATFFFIWSVPQRVRKTLVWVQVGVGTGVEVDICVEVPLDRHFVLEIKGKRKKTLFWHI